MFCTTAGDLVIFPYLQMGNKINVYNSNFALNFYYNDYVIMQHNDKTCHRSTATATATITTIITTIAIVATTAITTTTTAATMQVVG